MQIEIPQTARRIKIDIGLSYSAPNSVIWLDNQPDTFVIGIEPNIGNIYSVSTSALGHNSHFTLLPYAIDDVEEQTQKEFYHTAGDPGCSSLYEPNDKLPYIVAQKYKVDVIPLSTVLEAIDWDRFEYIDVLKIDTQGNDLNVIKSAGKWIHKVVYLHCEIDTHGHYNGTPAPDEYDCYLESIGFEKVKDGSIVDGVVVDRLYVNKKSIGIHTEFVNSFVL
jgi:FkbM family methyltransferase